MLLLIHEAVGKQALHRNWCAQGNLLVLYTTGSQQHTPCSLLVRDAGPLLLEAQVLLPLLCQQALPVCKGAVGGEDPQQKLPGRAAQGRFHAGAKDALLELLAPHQSACRRSVSSVGAGQAS